MHFYAKFFSFILFKILRHSYTSASVRVASVFGGCGRSLIKPLQMLLGRINNWLTCFHSSYGIIS